MLDVNYLVNSIVMEGLCLEEVVKVKIVNDGIAVSDIVAILSLSIAIITVIVSYIYNKMNIQFLTDQKNRLLPNTKISTKDYFKSSYIEKDSVIYFLNVEIQNSSYEKNAYVDAKFIINYKYEGYGQTYNLSPVKVHKYKNYDWYKLPVNINSNASMSQWLQFEIKKNVILDKQIESYQIDIIDIQGNRTSDTMIIINEEDKHIEKETY